MCSRTLTVMFAILTLCPLSCRAGTTPEYRTTASGYWSNPAIWEVPDPYNPGKWIATSSTPVCGNSAEIRHDVQIVTPVQEITLLTIDSGGSLTINADTVFHLCDTNPSITAIGSLIVEGTLELDASSGGPYLELRGEQTVPSCGGEIIGILPGSEIILSAGAGAAVMTNEGTVRGTLRILASNNGCRGTTFRNHGVVFADGGDELSFEDSLYSITDCTDASWMVDRFSTLTFRRGSSSLHGAITMLGSSNGTSPHGGQLNIDDSITTTGTLTVNYESVYVDTGKHLCVGAKTGSCSGFTSLGAWSGSGPFCLPAGTYNQCP